MQTVGQSAPFNGSADVALGVAYVGVYILLLSTVMFPLGLHKVSLPSGRSVSRD